MSPVDSNTTARTSSTRSTLASRSLAHTSCSVTRARRRLSCTMPSRVISTSGSLSTTRSIHEVCLRSSAIPNWIPNRLASAAAPRGSDGLGDRMVLASTDPTAIVITKSKLDIFEKLRSPTRRVSAITTP